MNVNHQNQKILNPFFNYSLFLKDNLISNSISQEKRIFIAVTMAFVFLTTFILSLNYKRWKTKSQVAELPKTENFNKIVNAFEIESKDQNECVKVSEKTVDPQLNVTKDKAEDVAKILEKETLKEVEQMKSDEEAIHKVEIEQIKAELVKMKAKVEFESEEIKFLEIAKSEVESQLEIFETKFYEESSKVKAAEFSLAQAEDRIKSLEAALVRSVDKNKSVEAALIQAHDKIKSAEAAKTHAENKLLKMKTKTKL